MNQRRYQQNNQQNNSQNGNSGNRSQYQYRAPSRKEQLERDLQYLEKDLNTSLRLRGPGILGINSTCALRSRSGSMPLPSTTRGKPSLPRSSTSRSKSRCCSLHRNHLHTKPI